MEKSLSPRLKKSFESELESAGKMQFDLGVTRQGLIHTKNLMAQTVSTYSSPREFLRQHSDMADSLVRKAFQNAQSQGSSPSVCLMAVGGYGRTELAPHSDIDLLLLYSASKKEDLPPLVERILYPLWDLGLDVSCSSRSISECLKTAQSDLHTKTSLIDGRYLDGEYEFFRSFYDLFLKEVLHRKVRNFAQDLAKDLGLRHKKYEDPNYTLEPNLKEGEGGLRDFQIGRWIIRAKYKTDRWDSILFPDHSRSLEKSLQLLWAVRNQLHLLSGRKQDDLTFELQEKISPILGFPQGTEGIEQMMRQYHLATQRISNFVHDILERAAREPSLVKKAFSFFQRRKIDENFGMAYGELCLLDPVTFKRDPLQLMVLFEHCQTHRVKMDFRTEEAVMESLPFIDDRFRASPEVNEKFLSLLKKADGASDILNKMHELGFLSRYIPEFSEVEGKVHYDLYHVHPVDSHSILAVEELEKLREGVYAEEYPLLTSLVRELENPGILLLTALLHDIGKGKEGNHSLAGAELVEQIGTRMGLSASDKESMVFLVSRHLSMLEIAFRRNLHDEQVILHFAHEVTNLVQLKMLYLLTFADIKAVGPEAWTAWKNTLLMELFLKTAHFLERGAVAEPFLRSDEILRKLRDAVPPEIMSEYADKLPDRYLSCYSSDEIAHHLAMARSVEKELLLVEWRLENE
ncbi:MAG TPA: [protein-PII] uridylyltransferase, partial [Thermodesulfobacteriota bacterium]|nr:[protein-PII] uridylyltransferase [Thermodesulfobacteriota bacterium]